MRQQAKMPVCFVVGRTSTGSGYTGAVGEPEIERVKREIATVPVPPPLPAEPQIAAAVRAS
jgi:hypothetical protein